MVKQKPRLVQRHNGSTKRYRLFIASKPEIVQRFSRSKGEELTDAGMSDPDTRTYFSIKKRGNRYTGMTNRPARHLEPHTVALSIAHQNEHLREMAFLDQHGFKRNSRSILAQMSEPFFWREPAPGWRTSILPSFQEMRRLCNEANIHSQKTIGGLTHFVLYPIVLSIVSLSNSKSQKNKLITSLFRSKEMKPYLEYLNSISSINIPTQEIRKIKKSLLAIIDFCETRVR